MNVDVTSCQEYLQAIRNTEDYKEGAETTGNQCRDAVMKTLLVQVNPPLLQRI